MARKSYKVTTKHPNGYKDGEHVLDVAINSDGTRYVTGRGWGCSRDYAVKTDREAIVCLLRENAVDLMSIKSA